MKIFRTKENLTEHLHILRNEGKKIGLVPTMGALHPGHISLVEASKSLCDITVVTIFVNPTQFNNKEDLLKYPKPIEHDQEMLLNAGADILFNPETEEMYQENEGWDYEVGYLNTVLEGAFRPGHYKGVTQIVFKLFDLVKPDYAFFGEKDYQQFLVIKKMNSDLNLGIQLMGCPIVRENDGLAMSSRNVRLNPQEREIAIQIYKSLLFAKANFNNLSLSQLQQEIQQFYKNDLLDLEYFEIVNPDNLKTIDKPHPERAIALVACTVGTTRLIDNMMLP